MAKKENSFMVVGLLAVGALLFFKKGINKRTAIIDYVNKGGDSDQGKAEWATLTNSFSDQEVSDIYELFYTYGANGSTVPAGALRDRLTAISAKYNIFT